MNFQIKVFPRKGIQDMWNAFMVEGASFTKNDIPIFHSSKVIPTGLISYDDAKSLYKKIIKNNPEFKDNRFVHFFVDDQKFDGKKSSIWTFPFDSLKVLSHFAGIITPDFSTYCDFPYPIKLFNIYKTRAYGYWCKKNGLEVIHNVRWGTEETWAYCFDGIPEGNYIAIGIVACGLKQKDNYSLFINGFDYMLKTIKPEAIIVYGSENYSFFKKLNEDGIKIVSFPSKTSSAFKRGVNCE